MEKNPNTMASMMVNLSQIIGQEEEGGPLIEQEKTQVLATIHEKVTLTTDASMEAPFTKEECRQALKKLDKEKALVCDGITTKF